ncbi:type ISP restriction/modification enzyme [Limnothrix sp. PR1529]|uniref:type ISP restriction/modification enzyme n=1 Tax=Limnothrix sp. PR1529 TaxID=1704291 RepID=UPI000AA85962|nr:type ISP restriction/modification enzyme [Limnothrix sp. PR1529]
MTQIYHAHLYGTRDSKYDWLQNHDVLSTNWQELKPQAPFYLLVPQNTDLLGEYEQGWKITDVMPVNSVGLYTARDHLAIQWSEKELEKILAEFISLPIEEARDQFHLGKDSRDWHVNLAQKDIQKTGLEQSNFKEISYRPFDKRFTFYTGNSRGLICMPRSEVMRHLLYFNNPALCFIRRSRENIFSNFWVANQLIDKTILSSADNANCAPLYLYPDRTEITQDRRVNFSPEFLKDLTAKLDTTPAPEAIFYYIYAVFHSPTYRHRYAEFLKIDFPRVPLTRNLNLFQKLAAYGEELVSLHLMQSPKLDAFVTEFEGNLNPVVDAGHPKYVKGKVVINKKGDGFTAVPEEVWSFYVGGYQVCQKWLKDRKGRTLSPEDITHYQRIIVALQETIQLMQKIDEAIPAFPLE